MPAPPRPLIQTVYYPESDGKPMGETDWHVNASIRLIELLRRHFTGQKVYVPGNLLLYYEQGDPKKFVVPDVFVVKGLAQKERRIFRTWFEQKVPNVVFEMTSHKTHKKDLVEKPVLYAKLGIPEYFLFEPGTEELEPPRRGFLDPPLQGYRLIQGDYERIVPDAENRLESLELGLKLWLEDGQLQLITPDGRRLLTGAEETALAYAAAAQAQAGADRAQADAARLAEENRRLREELARRKAD
jgi:Uma2 family endonuclease